jgi:hypothetical protein
MLEDLEQHYSPLTILQQAQHSLSISVLLRQQQYEDVQERRQQADGFETTLGTFKVAPMPPCIRRNSTCTALPPGLLLQTCANTYLCIKT